jgi:hypothetical protein
MFHDMGLTHQQGSAHEGFEVDCANVAGGLPAKPRHYTRGNRALHATPGIPQHMDPVVTLVTAGVEMDVLGIGYAEYSDAEREAVVQAEGQLTIAERTEPQASPR